MSRWQAGSGRLFDSGLCCPYRHVPLHLQRSGRVSHLHKASRRGERDRICLHCQATEDLENIDGKYQVCTCRNETYIDVSTADITRQYPIWDPDRQVGRSLFSRFGGILDVTAPPQPTCSVTQPVRPCGPWDPTTHHDSSSPTPTRKAGA